MGRGDKKSKKGKIWKGSYGKSRNKKTIKLRIKRLASVKKSVAGVTEAKPAVKRVTRKKESAS